MIKVCFKYDDVPDDDIVIDTTSSGNGKGFSPFLIGPVVLEPFDGPYGDEQYVSRNMENAWQYSKWYKEHDSYTWLEWAIDGWASKRANRYPMGKGAVPEFSLHKGERLGYIEARKQLYGPLYRQALAPRPVFAKLVRTARKESRTIWLKDFDGYQTDDDFETILNNPDKKMGHAFWIKHMVEEFL